MADILSVWFLTWLVCCSDEFPGILVVHRLGILFRDAQLVADLKEFQILLTVDIGDGNRNVFAGIKAAYAPETLIGRYIVLVANLQPRKMRFGLSEGMVLAAGPGDEDIFLLSPDTGAKPGMQVK